MKKNIFLILLSIVLIIVSGCSNSDDKKTDDKASEITSAVSETEKSEQSEQSSDGSSTESKASENETSSQTNLVMKNFGELWMGDQYYIDVLMTQEYDATKLGTSSQSSEISSESSDDGSTQKKVVYDYIIAVDFEKNIAGLNMFSDNGSKSTVVKDYQIYNINHADKTYTHTLYNGLAEDYGEEFTVNICLGIINNCTLTDSGKTTYKDKEVKYEKYTVESQLATMKDPEIVYYFDSSDKPVAEIVTTEAGKTTFDFRTVSATIPVSEILEVPSDYKDVTESSSSSSAS